MHDLRVGHLGRVVELQIGVHVLLRVLAERALLPRLERAASELGIAGGHGRTLAFRPQWREPRPSSSSSSASTPPRSASTPSTTPTTPATSRTTCSPPSRSSATSDVDVNDEFTARAYAEFYPYTLDEHGTETDGRLNEPHGVGFPLFILPAYILGGAHAVELFLALVAALAVALAYRLALRVVPDPWALGAAAVVGLSPPFLAYGTAVYPELTAGAALAGAALLALRLDERPRRREAFLCFALLGFLPWLGTKFVPAGIAIGFVAARGLWRARRRTLAIGVRRDLALQRRVLRGHQRGDLRRAHPLRRRPSRRHRHRRRLARRLRGPRLPPRGPLHRPQRRPAALGARCSCSPSPGSGGSGACTATTCRGRWPTCARSSSPAASAPSSWESSWLVASFLAPTMFGFSFPPRHLLAALPLAIPLVALGLRHMPRTGHRARRRSPWSGASGSTPTWGSSAARS